MTAFRIIESVMFCLSSAGVLYLLIFALASLRKHRTDVPRAGNLKRTAVIVPAYREDEVVGVSAAAMLAQDYPRELYDVIVVSDRMKPETDRRLEESGVIVLKAGFENSSKAKALNFAVERLKGRGYDTVVIMDADNTAPPDFLRRMNDAREAGMTAVQAHRRAQNLDSDTAVLDAVSEEINNSVFRLGHVNLGFSSALIGSGMAFDYKWFEENIRHVSSAGEDKELEALLLRQGIYIGYMPDAEVFDQKTRREGVFYRQRRRWLAAQLQMFGRTVREFPGALLARNYDYCDKMLQWIMPPRVVLLGFIGLFAVAVTAIDAMSSVKWWGLLVAMLFALCAAVPDYLVGPPFYRAMRKVPLLGFLMFLNLFRLRGAGKKFIHTEHSDQSSAQA